jgi:hypothetical protein
MTGGRWIHPANTTLGGKGSGVDIEQPVEPGRNGDGRDQTSPDVVSIRALATS